MLGPRSSKGPGTWWRIGSTRSAATSTPRPTSAAAEASGSQQIGRRRSAPPPGMTENRGNMRLRERWAAVVLGLLVMLAGSFGAAGESLAQTYESAVAKFAGDSYNDTDAAI